MTPAHQFATAILTLTLSSLAWLSSPIPVEATPIVDTLVLKGSDKAWCQGNPKFVEALTVKATDGVTVTLIQDPLDMGDVTTIQATINNSRVADIDAITLKGLAFPMNKFHSTAQLVLFGTHPSDPDHFFTMRGQATFDKTGHLTRVTGTVWDHISDTYTIDKHGTQSGPVECFDNVTFVTVKKPPSSGGGVSSETGGHRGPRHRDRAGLAYLASDVRATYPRTSEESRKM